ncbi:hypothetical protein XCR_0025 [Xanthomonas campestris pv. raphani 756C]|nr:hypothetical protein XCR_0025 [Xanthomonas campestris pv. raphani 756C]
MLATCNDVQGARMTDTTARFSTRRIGGSVARITRTCGLRYPDWSCCCAAHRFW